jgi:ubiquinone/menaquinone biosynthesis C-methylase UbiE
MNESFVTKNASAYDAMAESWEKAMYTNVGHKYLEKPAMHGELPNTLEGKTVLSIGVGGGDELKEILKRNPARVVAIDISKKLLSISSGKHPSVEFKEMDMMKMDLPDAEFDFIYSSLTLHYANDWDALLREISRVLKPGGTLLFSTHNPSYWALKPKTGNEYTNERGIALKEHTATLPGDVEITFFNHPNKESIKEALKHAGFILESFFNPTVLDVEVSEEEKEKYQRLKETDPNNPRFLIVKAVKS